MRSSLSQHPVDHGLLDGTCSQLLLYGVCCHWQHVLPARQGLLLRLCCKLSVRLTLFGCVDLVGVWCPLHPSGMLWSALTAFVCRHPSDYMVIFVTFIMPWAEAYIWLSRIAPLNRKLGRSM